MKGLWGEEKSEIEGMFRGADLYAEALWKLSALKSQERRMGGSFHHHFNLSYQWFGADDHLLKIKKFTNSPLKIYSKYNFSSLDFLE